MRLLWLPEVLRSAGLTVHEVSGWRTRGSNSFDPRGIICHETRGSRTSTDAGEIGVLLNGSNTAPPPIAQLYLSRTGHWHVVASGRCNHVRTGWAGPFKGVGNTGLVGIEAQHALGEAWTDRQYDSYVRGVAALKQRTGWGVGGHKEHQPGGHGHASSKTDPGFNMDQFRRDVAEMLAGGMDTVSLKESIDLPTIPGVKYSSPSKTGEQLLGGAYGYTLQVRNQVGALAAQVAALTGVVETLAETIRAGGGSVDTAAILTGVDERVARAEAKMRDAVADLGEGGAEQVRAG